VPTGVSTGGASSAGASSSTGGVATGPIAGSAGFADTNEAPGCSLRRAPRSQAALALFVLSALLGFRRRRGRAQRR
jgi:hypothetical protein